MSFKRAISPIIRSLSFESQLRSRAAFDIACVSCLSATSVLRISSSRTVRTCIRVLGESRSPTTSARAISLPQPSFRVDENHPLSNRYLFSLHHDLFRVQSTIVDSSPTKSPGSTSKSPHQVLEACILNYRHAKSYRDNAIIRTVRNGSNLDQICRIQFRRPNFIRVETSRTLIDCDGQEWSLRVTDSQDPWVLRQRWVRKAPESIDLGWMMSEPQVEMLLSDSELGIPMQLELLMHPKALDFFLQESARLSWLDPQSSDGHPANVSLRKWKSANSSCGSIKI